MKNHTQMTEHIYFLRMKITLQNVLVKAVTLNHRLYTARVSLRTIHIFSSLYKCQLMQSTRLDTCDLY